MQHHQATLNAHTCEKRLPIHGKSSSLLNEAQFDPNKVAIGINQRAHIRFSELMALTGMKKSTLWAIQDTSASQYDPTFPSCYQLTARTKVWRTLEVLAWIESKQVVRVSTSSPALKHGKEVLV